MKPHKEKMEKNIWENNFYEVVSVIKELSKKHTFDKDGNYEKNSNRWAWFKNSKCKYISLRIDMRDGGFIILDRDDNRISLEELKSQ